MNQEAWFIAAMLVALFCFFLGRWTGRREMLEVAKEYARRKRAKLEGIQVRSS